MNHSGTAITNRSISGRSCQFNREASPPSRASYHHVETRLMDQRFLNSVKCG